MWEPEAVASWGGYYIMLEEVNQYRVGSDMGSFKLLEDKVAANPGDFNKLVLEFKYPDPAGVELKGRDRVPTSPDS